MINTSTSKNSLLLQSKDTSKQNQLATIFQYLQNNIVTASMLSEATNIPQKNITRYKRDLELSNHLWEVKKEYCKKTGFKAWYITTNEKYKTHKQQLELFTA